MFNQKRCLLYDNYILARNYFIKHPQILINIEHFITNIVNGIIALNYTEFERDYNEASYLHAFWANYPPYDRGRAPVGDQIPWIEVGEHAIGHKLTRLISADYSIREVGLPSGADNRFILYSNEISQITQGFTNCVFLFLDIKSVGPRDNFNHIVISPYQVSGDGLWHNPNDTVKNSIMIAKGQRVEHEFYPAISPIYSLTNGDVAPTIHLFVKPIYKMLSSNNHGQPLEAIKNICVPNGLLLSCAPNYLKDHPTLFYPGKDDKAKDALKTRARVSFDVLKEIAPWRVNEFY